MKKSARRRMTPEKRRKKQQEWASVERRAKRGPRKAPLSEVPDGDEEVIALKRAGAEAAIRLLRDNGFDLIQLGRLDDVIRGES